VEGAGHVHILPTLLRTQDLAHVWPMLVMEHIALVRYFIRCHYCVTTLTIKAMDPP
jgi:hypothetical protein